jgi:hypothetical protein
MLDTTAQDRYQKSMSSAQAMDTIEAVNQQALVAESELVSELGRAEGGPGAHLS